MPKVIVIDEVLINLLRKYYGSVFLAQMVYTFFRRPPTGQTPEPILMHSTPKRPESRTVQTFMG